MLQFAKELLTSAMLAYNHGEPSAGLTSPLFALACSFAYLLIRDWYWAGMAAGFASFLLLLGVGTGYCRRSFGDVTAFAYAVLLVANGRLLYLSLIGLESVAFAAMIMVLAYSVRYSVRPGVNGVVLGLAYLCRPDALFTCPVLALVYASRGKWRHAAVDLLVCLIVISPWLAFCFWQNGTPFPNTVITKSIAVWSWTDRWEFVKLVMFLSSQGGLFERLVDTMAGTSTWELWRLYVPIFGLSLFVLAAAPQELAVIFGTAMTHVAALVWKRPGAAEWQRYLTLEHLVVVVAMAVVLGRIYATVARTWSITIARVGIATTLAAALTLFLPDLNWQASARNLISRYFYSLDYRTGLWLASNVHPSTRIGLYQAGGVKFFSGLYAVDFGELMAPKLSDYKRRRAGYQAILDYEIDYLAEFGRDWLVAWGVPDSEDPRFFQPVREGGYAGRGLVRVDRQAIAAHLRAAGAASDSAP